MVYVCTVLDDLNMVLLGIAGVWHFDKVLLDAGVA